MPGIFHLFHHQHILACRIFNASYFGALEVVMVVGEICEMSGCKSWFRIFFRNNFCNFKAVCNPPHCVRKASYPKKSWGADKVRDFLRSLYVGISTATWVAAQSPDSLSCLFEKLLTNALLIIIIIPV